MILPNKSLHTNGRPLPPLLPQIKKRAIVTAPAKTKKNTSLKIQPGRDGVDIYHVVFVLEDFDQTVFHLLLLIQRAQRNYPGQKRNLYLDIEGHRNASGGFDNDMLELQKEFTLGLLLSVPEPSCNAFIHNRKPSSAERRNP
jgi:hypothetical protein